MIQAFYWVIFGVAVLTFVIVQILLFWSAVRFRQPDGEDKPLMRWDTSRRELAWTLLPAVVTVVVLVFSMQVMIGK